MDEKLRYPFRHNESIAQKDATTFYLYSTGRISKLVAIASISACNGAEMSVEQFDYYVVNLGYTRKVNK